MRPALPHPLPPHRCVGDLKRAHAMAVSPVRRDLPSGRTPALGMDVCSRRAGVESLRYAAVLFVVEVIASRQAGVASCASMTVCMDVAFRAQLHPMVHTYSGA